MDQPSVPSAPPIEPLLADGRVTFYRQPRNVGRRGAAHLALRRAARAERSAVLIWHQVGPAAPAAHEVVRTVPTDAFAAQLDLLCELGEVVPLGQLERPGTGSRPRFALTFDDDDPGHARHGLPALVDRGLPATFLLSGRWLHGLGPYWWELIESDIRTQGAAPVAERLGPPTTASPVAVTETLTGTAATRDLAATSRGRPPSGMGDEDARALVDAGMEIGFHTIDHPVLPTLDDDALAAAVANGRQELADALGAPIERFAYPHGRADARVAEATAAAGYSGAWTTTKRVVEPSTPAMLRGRWDIHWAPAARRDPCPAAPGARRTRTMTAAHVQQGAGDAAAPLGKRQTPVDVPDALWATVEAYATPDEEQADA
jgi:peptidoglycan/xylan/chitin deacetylase (PgdA/CDA1 family)